MKTSMSFNKSLYPCNPHPIKLQNVFTNPQVHPFLIDLLPWRGTYSSYFYYYGNVLSILELHISGPIAIRWIISDFLCSTWHFEIYPCCFVYLNSVHYYCWVVACVNTTGLFLKIILLMDMWVNPRLSHLNILMRVSKCLYFPSAQVNTHECDCWVRVSARSTLWEPVKQLPTMNAPFSIAITSAGFLLLHNSIISHSSECFYILTVLICISLMTHAPTLVGGGSRVAPTDPLPFLLLHYLMHLVWGVRVGVIALDFRRRARET